MSAARAVGELGGFLAMREDRLQRLRQRFQPRGAPVLA
jgi:hypothetical protein